MICAAVTVLKAQHPKENAELAKDARIRPLGLLTDEVPKPEGFVVDEFSDGNGSGGFSLTSSLRGSPGRSAGASAAPPSVPRPISLSRRV